MNDPKYDFIVRLVHAPIARTEWSEAGLLEAIRKVVDGEITVFDEATYQRLIAEADAA